MASEGPKKPSAEIIDITEYLKRKASDRAIEKQMRGEQGILLKNAELFITAAGTMASFLERFPRMTTGELLRVYQLALAESQHEHPKEFPFYEEAAMKMADRDLEEALKRAAESGIPKGEALSHVAYVEEMLDRITPAPDAQR